MYFNRIIVIIFGLIIKPNLAYNCLPCTCETKDLLSASCNSKTVTNKINAIPLTIQKYNDRIGELDFEGQIFTELSDLSDFINVKKIIFSFNLINNIHPKCFNKLIALETLYLNNNQITELSPEHFINNYKIQHIFLNHNRITSLPKHLFNNLSDLNEVHLNNNSIKHITPDSFFQVPKLKTLDLSNNKLKTLNLNFIDDFHSLNLTYFHKNLWVCDVSLCDLINHSLKRNLLRGKIPQCFHSNGSISDRSWEDLHILKPMEIVRFQSPVNTSENVIFTCEIHSCSIPSMMWNFNGNNLQNSQQCFQGFKHTLIHQKFGIIKDDEGLYTCLINDCSFCGNSSRKMEVNVETIENEENTTDDVKTMNPEFNSSDTDINIDIPELPCLSCIICLIMGLFIGIILGIIIGFLIIVFCLPCCRGLACCVWIIKQLTSAVNRFNNNKSAAEQTLLQQSK